MKIQSNSNDHVSLRARNAGGEAAQRAGRTASPAARISSSDTQNVISQLSSQRNLSNALSIAQTAQSLVSRALSVSAQLRNIASQALITGRSNPEKLDQLIAQITTSMSEVSRESSIPVPRPAVSHTAQGTPQQVTELPSPGEEYAALKQAAAGLRAGTTASPEQFDAIDSALSRKSDLINGYVQSLEGPVRDFVGTIQSGTHTDAAEMTRKTAESVMANPSAALTAQGNIRSDIAGNILA
ncbi:MAG TPA: hypothetical protein PLI62_02095 [Spirochaetota bacterium]|nr:hypothetical protein [Spirochaetota bacterium]